MSFFSKKKEQWINFQIFLQAKRLPRKKEFNNLETSKRVGILFNYEEDENLIVIKKFVKHLKNQEFKVSVIGWIEDDNLPDNVVGSPILFFCRKDISWTGKPSIPEVQEFIEQPLDLLFDLTGSSSITMHYMASLSQAACKVGRYAKDNNHLDLMIDCGTPFSIEKLIEHSISYLTQIKKMNS